MGLINTTVLKDAPLRSQTGDSGGTDTKDAPAFITIESLTSFAGQVTAITIVWKVLGAADAESKLIPAVAAAVIALALWIKTLSGVKGTDIPASFVIAAINAFIVYSAVIGVDVTGDQAGISDATNEAIDDASK